MVLFSIFQLKMWTNYSAGLPNLPVNCILYQNNTNNALYVGTDVGVYYINDTIPTWQSFFNGLPNVDVEELEIAYSINKLRAATNGRGLWETDIHVLAHTPLPIGFLNFTGRYNTSANSNDLQWTTESTINNNYFEVMKSADGKYFTSIGKVNVTGNSNQQNTYNFSDSMYINGINYYFIRQVDYNGKTTTSNTISITNNKEEKIITVFPNPANDKIQFQFLKRKQVYDLELFDIMGKQIIMQPALQINGDGNNTVDISFLTAGIYFLKIINHGDGEFLYGRFVKK